MALAKEADFWISADCLKSHSSESTLLDEELKGVTGGVDWAEWVRAGSFIN